MIPIDQNARIDQVHLKVSYLNSSLEFYKSFLGFKIVEQTDHAVFLSCDGKLPYLVALSTTKSFNLIQRAGLSFCNTTSAKKRFGRFSFTFTTTQRYDKDGWLFRPSCI